MIIIRIKIISHFIQVDLKEQQVANYTKNET